MRHDRRMRSRLLLAPALLTALALAGCGGDDDEPDTLSAKRLAYAKSAEGVCSRALAAGRTVPMPQTTDQYVASFKATAAVGQEGLRGLSALTPPPEDVEALKMAFLDPLAEQVARFQAAIPLVEAAAEASDPAEALGRIPDPGRLVTVNFDYVEQYGMPVCAQFLGKR